MTTERWTNDEGQEFEVGDIFIWCNTCGFAWDKIHRVEEPEQERCPSCTIDALEKLVEAAREICRLYPLTISPLG